MISEDFAFFGFDDTSWDRLVSLFLGGNGEERPRGVLVLVIDSERMPVACFHTATGSVDPATLPDVPTLEALCDATEAGYSNRFAFPEMQQDDCHVCLYCFEDGSIAKVSALYGPRCAMAPFYNLRVYGTKGSLQSEFTDNRPGEVRVVLDGPEGPERTTTPFEAERDKSVYGHGAAVIRYMRHFQQCLDEDREPSPGVLDGAKSVAAGVAAWESVRTGEPVEVFNDF